GGQPRDGQLPHARFDAFAHRVAAAVPAVEIADDGDASGVRRPDREAYALDVAVLHLLRAEHASDLAMIAFGEQIQIHVAEQHAEGIWILGFLHAAGPLDAQQVLRTLT